MKAEQIAELQALSKTYNPVDKLTAKIIAWLENSTLNIDDLIKNYETALLRWDAFTLNKIGEYYRTKENHEKALELFFLASKEGSNNAMYYCAEAYLMGLGTTQDINKAIEYLPKSNKYNMTDWEKAFWMKHSEIKRSKEQEALRVGPDHLNFLKMIDSVLII